MRFFHTFLFTILCSAVVLPTLPARSVFACSPATNVQPVTAQEILGESDAVFTGKVLSIEQKSSSSSEVTFDVTRYWKGDAGQYLRVMTFSDGQCSMPYPFVVDASYLVYAARDTQRDSLVTLDGRPYRHPSGSVGTQLLSNADVDLRLLGEGRIPARSELVAFRREARRQEILREARPFFAGGDAASYAVGMRPDHAAESETDARVVARVLSRNVNANDRRTMLEFVHYGTPTTRRLGAGERAGVIASFFAALGKYPTTLADMEDVMAIANGRFPMQTNAAREIAVQATFARIYRRAANRANTNDDAAIVIMAYGLRQEEGNRNLASERIAIRTFTAIYGKAPATASEWDAVRAIAYSGATR